MIRLVDGPAAGALALERAPIFLRAVVDPAGKIEALDQLDDKPEPGEKVYVYEQTAYRGQAFITLQRPRRCVHTHSADYRHRDDVDGEQVRDREAWRAWCLAQPVADKVGIEVPS